MEKPPTGLLSIGLFLFFGAAMAAIAGVTLVWPGTILDHLWTLNASAYTRLAPLGRVIGVPFLILTAALAVAATGWFKRRVWGWGLAVAIIATQVLGDMVNIILGEYLRGGIGFAIAGALLFYLLTPRVRAAFKKTRVSIKT